MPPTAQTAAQRPPEATDTHRPATEATDTDRAAAQRHAEALDRAAAAALTLSMHVQANSHPEALEAASDAFLQAVNHALDAATPTNPPQATQ